MPSLIIPSPPPDASKGRTSGQGYDDGPDPTPATVLSTLLVTFIVVIYVMAVVEPAIFFRNIPPNRYHLPFSFFTAILALHVILPIALLILNDNPTDTLGSFLITLALSTVPALTVLAVTDYHSTAAVAFIGSVGLIVFFIQFAPLTLLILRTTFQDD